MEKDYNSVLMSWRDEKLPQHFSRMLKMMISAFDGPINDNDLPDLINIMYEVITNLDLVGEFMDDEEFDIILDNENLSNSEEPETVIVEKIVDLILNKLVLPNNAPSIEKWINQLIEIIWIIYDEGFSEEMDDISVAFEKIGNYLVLQKRDEEAVILLKAMKERDCLDNYVYSDSQETFDGLLYLALEKENDTLGCLVTEAFENLCGMYEEGWEKFFPFLLQMYGAWINKDDIDPEEFDVDFLNAVRGTKYEEIIRKEFPDFYKEVYITGNENSGMKDNPNSIKSRGSNCTNNTSFVSTNQEKLSSINDNKLSLKKPEDKKKSPIKKVKKSSPKPKTASSAKKYRPKGIKGYFYGIYKIFKGKKK